MCVVESCDVLRFFFVKQNTAYDIRISDWSSDVCSSDLGEQIGDVLPLGVAHRLEEFVSFGIIELRVHPRRRGEQHARECAPNKAHRHDASHSLLLRRGSSPIMAGRALTAPRRALLFAFPLVVAACSPHPNAATTAAAAPPPARG